MSCVRTTDLDVFQEPFQQDHREFVSVHGDHTKALSPLQIYIAKGMHSFVGVQESRAERPVLSSYKSCFVCARW